MEQITSIQELEECLSRPTAGALSTLEALEGDVAILGAGGKMGPTLARMVKRGSDLLGQHRRIFAVSRFSTPGVADALRQHGVETIPCELLDRAALTQLPDVAHVILMTARKFGMGQTPEAAWAVNALLPALVAERYARSRLVVFSTGCVYAMAPINGHGSREDDPLDPPGEYAASCVGRERIVTHCALQHSTPTVLLRLNYAIDLRYGVLLDVAQRVAHGAPVDVTTGFVNVIWQGDANARAIQSLALARNPPDVINVTGRERISVRSLATRFGELLGRAPLFTGSEAPTAWLSDASRSFEKFGQVSVSLEEMILATADWVRRGGATLGKPTQFATRDGRF